MSYFGPNAVVDDDKARVYDYQEDRTELESAGSVNAPSQSGPFGPSAAASRMTQNVPLQPLADMWKHISAATPQEVEQRLRAQPNMWMPAPPGSAPPMLPPGFMPPPEMMMMFPNGMPPMPPMAPNGMPGMPPPNGMPNGMPGMPPPNGGMPPPPSNGMPGMPPMPPFGAPPIWGTNDSQSQTNASQPPFPFPQPPWGFNGLPNLGPNGPAGLSPLGGANGLPSLEPVDTGLEGTAPVEAEAAPESALAAAATAASADASALESGPRTAKPRRGKAEDTSRDDKRDAKSSKPAAKSTHARRPKSRSPEPADPVALPTGPATATADPYSLTPKARAPARSIAENRQQNHAPPASSGKLGSPRTLGSNQSNAPNSRSAYGRAAKHTPASDQYFHESEKLRPNRRFRHMMTDNDKRHVMEKCVKSMANDDPFVDDFYFHVYTKIHGREVSPRESAKYYKFYEKGDGSASEKMRQQVQRAVERAQESRQRRQEQQTANADRRNASADGQSQRGFHRSMGGTTRPRQALPALFALQNAKPGRSVVSRTPADDSAHASVLSSVLTEAAEQEDSASERLCTPDVVLHKIERVYDQIMALEEHAQSRPDPQSPQAAEWASQGPPLQNQLWASLDVQKPEDAEGKQPFMQMLTIPKGMKAFARSWSQLDPTRRLTVLTRITVNIDDLAPVTQNAAQLELFNSAVVQPLVHLVGTADFSTILLIADLARSRASALGQSRIGQLLLTAVVSRGEMLSQELQASVEAGECALEQAEEIEQWGEAFALLFEDILPALPALSVRDDSTWHFLAALALGSDLDRQSELVDLLRKQIFAQHNAAKTATGAEGERKIAALNLFLNVLGLNATMDEITEL